MRSWYHSCVCIYRRMSDVKNSVFVRHMCRMWCVGWVISRTNTDTCASQKALQRTATHWCVGWVISRTNTDTCASQKQSCFSQQQQKNSRWKGYKNKHVPFCIRPKDCICSWYHSSHTPVCCSVLQCFLWGDIKNKYSNMFLSVSGPKTWGPCLLMILRTNGKNNFFAITIMFLKK